MSWSPVEEALCRHLPPDQIDRRFFTGTLADQHRTIAQWCRPCPVRTDCLVLAMDTPIEHGVAGATTQVDRQALWQVLPDLTWWGRWLYRARGWQRVRPTVQEARTLLDPLRALECERALEGDDAARLRRQALRRWDQLGLLTRVWLLVHDPAHSPAATCHIRATGVLDAGAPT